jgi:hypothetical protein
MELMTLRVLVHVIFNTSVENIMITRSSDGKFRLSNDLVTAYFSLQVNFQSCMKYSTSRIFSIENSLYNFDLNTQPLDRT